MSQEDTYPSRRLIMSSKVLILSKILAYVGVHPTKYRRHKPYFAKIPALISLLMIIFRCSMIILYSLINVESSVSPLQSTLFFLSFFGFPQMSFAAQIYDTVRRRNTLYRYTRLLVYIKYVLSKNGLRTSINVSWWNIVGISLIHLALLFQSKDFFSTSPILLSIYHLIMTSQFLIVHFALISYLDDLSGWFALLLSSLKELECRPASPLRTDKILTLSWAHGVLCSAALILNQAISLRALLIITEIFFQLVITLQFLYQDITDRFDSHAFAEKMLPIRLLAVLYFINVLHSTVSSFNGVSKKANKFNDVLYKLMIGDKTDELIHNPKLRLHINMKRTLEFTACGFFNLDYPLVFTVMASGTSYLFILIQFAASQNSS